MRLGDLDALKDDAFEVYQGNGVELKTLMVVPLCEIDNAPTVPNEYMRGYEAAMREYKRPQGKWIFRNGVTCGGYYKCSKCGEVERAEKNYCSNCGAKMKGEE